jgi:hypothetical protein
LDTFALSHSQSSAASLLSAGQCDGVAGTYNYSAYPEEVREALDKWAVHVGKIVGEGLASAAAVA